MSDISITVINSHFSLVFKIAGAGYMGLKDQLTKAFGINAA